MKTLYLILPLLLSASSLLSQSRWQPGIIAGYETGYDFGSDEHAIYQHGYSIGLRTELKVGKRKKSNSLRIGIEYLRVHRNENLNRCEIKAAPNVQFHEPMLSTHFYHLESAFIVPLEYKYRILKKPFSLYLFHGITNWFYDSVKGTTTFYYTDTLCNIISDRKTSTYRLNNFWNGFELTTGFCIEYPLSEKLILQFEPTAHLPFSLSFSVGCKLILE